MNYNKEELFLKRHLAESADAAYYTGTRLYTDFLTLHEISIFHASLPVFPDIPYSFWGGAAGAERVRACFHGDISAGRGEIKDMDALNPALYPISCVHIRPSAYQFAEDLTHRDYLGAVLNLGLQRNKIGDIILKDKDAYLFCDPVISSFITAELGKVRHTNMKSSVVPFDTLASEGIFEKQFETIYGSVASVRLDSLVKTAFHVSRSSILPYIDGGKVFVNGKETLSSSYPVKEEDIISVRGLGKFRYDGQCGISKKGKINIKILKYM